MKLKFPAEAFALGILLFSAGMQDAFVYGVLVILAAVLSEWIRTSIDGHFPRWSVCASVLIASGAVTASAFRWADFALDAGAGGWLLMLKGALIGLLAAKSCLEAGWDADYGEICWESGLAWGFWILCAILREFLASGEIFGNKIAEISFRSSAFGGWAFGFLAAGVVLGLVNVLAKRQYTGGDSLYVMIPAVCLVQPFQFPLKVEWLGMALAAGITLVLFLSVRKVLAFSSTGSAMRRLPIEMVSMGLIFLILGTYK
ncbi:MAG: hypothetical protein ACOX6P_11900 [Candidatus Merdivicinus sp.]|jgi:hypothetical protein